jgi:hypothetical protein
VSKFVDQFKTPQNGYVERGTTPFSFILCLLFGPLYFLMKGNFKHFLLSAILVLPSCGFSWLVYPFGVYEVNRAHYMKRGWLAV